MTTEPQIHEALRFRADFASRVLDEADRVAARRQRVLSAGVLAAAVAVTGAAGLWSMLAPRATAPVVTFAMNTQSASQAVAESALTEPLDYMFPEAAPLAQFTDDYSGGVIGRTTTRRNILFAGDTGQDAADSTD
jgi:hypothetical protein